ncbi:MAG: type IV secretion system protein [bacterium]|nr:type IV secretion system protein [bacterium]
MNLNTIKKYGVFPLSLMLITAFVVPVDVASAQQDVFGFIGSLGQIIPDAIGWIFSRIMLAIPTGLLFMSSLMLQQSIDPQFIRVPYTTGGVIDVAWPIVRDFANMLLVLILIFIGLGTALRLGDYEAKKALPRLVAIAVLINFAPVLMGFVVDATNIVMNFFLEGLLGTQVLTSVGSNLDAIISGSSGNSNFPAFLAKILAIGFFNILTAVIFFFYATLFFVRKVMIWILVILSPIALISLILPATKGFFTKWFDQFIEWSTVGIFAAFFLWLGDHTIALAAKGGFTSQLPETGNLPVVRGLANIFNEVIPFIIADIVLLIGFFMGLQSNAMGFNAIKSHSFGMNAPEWMAGKAKSGAQILGSSAWRRVGAPISDKVGKGLQRLGGYQTSLAEKIPQGVQNVPLLGGTLKYAVRSPGGALQMLGSALMKPTAQMQALDDVEMAKAKTAASGKNPEVLINELIATLGTGNLAGMNKAIGLVNGLIGNNDVDDLNTAIKAGRLNMGDLKRVYQAAWSRGPHVSRSISKAFVGQMDALGVGAKEQESTLKKLSDDDFKNDRVLAEYLNPEIKIYTGKKDANGDDEVDKEKTEAAQKLSRETLDKIMKEKGSDVMPGLLRRAKRTDRQAIWNYVQSLGPDWFVGNDAEDILTWSTSSTARGLGVKSIGNLTEDGLKEYVQNYRRPIPELNQEIERMRTQVAENDSKISTLENERYYASEPEMMKEVQKFKQVNQDIQGQIQRMEQVIARRGSAPSTASASRETLSVSPDTGEGSRRSQASSPDTGAGSRFREAAGGNNTALLRRELFQRGGRTNEQINAMTDDEVRTAYTRMGRGEA